MPHRFLNDFYPMNWNDVAAENDDRQSAAEKYQKVVTWAGKARRQNPQAFDALTEWILDDSKWCEEHLAENERIFKQGVIARFKKQNALLRTFLQQPEFTGVVHVPVFSALDSFDAELSGMTHDENLRETVVKVFADFSAMRERSIREIIAGNKTGPTGTDSVDVFGYINHLKNCDAQVQWTLFMPELVKEQQKGFKVESFEYKKLNAMRFIGREDHALSNVDVRKKLFGTLDAMRAYQSGFDHDLLFMHHGGLGVDIGPWHGVWGRFMKADTPVPDGFISFDFIAHHDGKAGPPYCSQFAYATFSGDNSAMHAAEGYDSDAMYDVTRNIILGQGVNIPYPSKYWTAEVFPNGCDKDSSAYLFSVDL